MDFTKNEATTKLESLICDFPFLARYAGDVSSYRIHIRIIDLGLMQEVPYTTRANWRGCVSELNFKSLILLDVEGNEIHTVASDDRRRTQQFSYFSPKTWFRRRVHGERVGEALEKISNPNDVVYIVELRWDATKPKTWNPSILKLKWIFIRKLPKKTNLLEHITTLQKEAGIT